MPVTIGAKPESNFTNPIGLLSDCHRRIERFLDVLVNVVAEGQGRALNPQQRTALETALLYFHDAAPKHTADEEESLFPRLRAMQSPEMRALLGRVDSLEADHAVAGRAHAELHELGEQWLRGSSLTSAQAARMAALLGELRNLYRRHIGIEDGEVFPAAAAALSPPEREAIGREMASRRGVR
jgi:hemerythrin-like domain-containing protein